MAKDPGFIFYPGDYLRDTQVLSEAVQVAYDRIMCEHMRNICVSYEQLKFFTKKLNADEVAELKAVLVEEKGKGYYIEWVRSAIEKRREYSKSRANNRIGKKKPSPKKPKNISTSYDNHMENEDDNENEVGSKADVVIVLPFQTETFKREWEIWKKYRHEQHKFKYKPISEQAALIKISKLARDETTAIAIIRQSIENSWKGFFELTTNGKQSTHSTGTGKFNLDIVAQQAADLLAGDDKRRQPNRGV